ncbi:hypothetical protein AUR04nite_04280 [Glutamicibacter uratoxydans]|uniref:4'-phosphopantetheinyl transferase domain-containing protein n=1 Tax=Glutamicibacter uratoxydans TaxID=43667 RepID=A0A4Y4DIW0_GLUUR|nr:4'-phosphopantetheinyl transferase superfamily protein [Glutamicibacter uratoxydans]GED04896.1 hypothetical protein AUR04nite_04280 [Glutamicibacter uratoxydans]
MFLSASPQQVTALVQGLGGYEQLLGAEASAARKLKFPADAQALLSSRALLRLLLAHELGVGLGQAAALDITRHCPDCGPSDHGQPRHALRTLSMSRTRELVIAAVAPAQLLLGVDVERGPSLNSTGIFEGFDDTVLSLAEKALLAEAENPDQLRLNAFSAKEALLKSLGIGLRIAPSSIDALGASQGLKGWARVKIAHAGGQELAWRELQLGPEHIGTLAASRPLPVRQLTLQDLVR